MNMWDKRYNSPEYVYGKEPNEFFAAELKKLKPGLILLPAEGEGRNAVFAAEQGWKVHAFDSSQVAEDKALSLAAGLGRVQLNRKIKALTGQTTVSFIRSFRLNRAAELIKAKSSTIAEIAYDVGFSSPSYFSECFRQYFGVLPSDMNGNQQQ